LDRRRRTAWRVLPVALFAWPLVWAVVVPQQAQRRDAAAIDSADLGLEPLVSELPDESIRPASTFVLRERPQSWPRLVPSPCGAAAGERDALRLVGVSWEPGIGDRIVVRSLRADGSEVAPAKDGAVPKDASGATLSIGEDGCEMLRPAAAIDGAGRLVVVWTETTDRGPVLRAVRVADGKPGPIVTLTDPARAARDAEVALLDGRIWCCFECWTPRAAGSDKGSVGVVLAPLDEERLGEAVAIAGGTSGDRDPVVVAADRRLWIAWSRYAGRDYEVTLRSFDPGGGTLGEPLDVSADAQSDDLHPSLAAGTSGEIWVAWDRIVDPGRGSSAPRSFVDRYANAPAGVSVMTACVRDGKVLLPAGRRGSPAGVVVGAPQFSWTGGLPRLAMGDDGRPWLAYRYLAAKTRTRPYGYAVVAHHWVGNGGASANGAATEPSGGWSAPISFQGGVGAEEEPAVLAVGGGALVAWSRSRLHPVDDLCRQSFDRAVAPAQLAASIAAAQAEVRGDVDDSPLLVARVDDSGASGGAEPDAKPVPREPRLTPPHYHPAADPIADPWVTGARHFEVTRGDRTWKAYWGDLHRHSCVSPCSNGMEERPVQRWESGRDVHLYDFMALTDHTGLLDPIQWRLQDKLIRQQRTPDFCALAGYEWSSSAEGHQNVILAGRLTPLLHTNRELPDFYRLLSRTDAITIPHGTADLGRCANLRAWDREKVCLVEVYQALRGSSEFDGCVRQSPAACVDDHFVQDALATGHVFGLIASSDHGNGCAYAVALAERLDAASLFEAFRARRTYAATTKGMLIDFRIDDHVMGEECRCAAPPRVHVKVRGAAELAEVVVFRDRAVFAAVRAEEDAANRAERIAVALTLPDRLDATGGAPFRLEMSVPGCALSNSGCAAFFRRDHPGVPYARWTIGPQRATFDWPASCAIGPRDSVLRIDVSGPLDAKVAFTWEGGSLEQTFAGLLTHPFNVPSPRGPVRVAARRALDRIDESSKGLGVREFEDEWTDHDARKGRHWYYARAIQVDGEVVWSSPVFVDRE
jgi:hypothetical protein